MNLTVNEIRNICDSKEELEKGDREVSGVVIDSRLVGEGFVFVAVTGERANGHSFLKQVFEKGAACAVISKNIDEVCREYGFDKENLGPCFVVEDTLKTLTAIAAYYRSKLSIPIVGITGSVGKTSTKELIAGVLSVKYNVLKTQGNFNNEIGLPLTLLRIDKEHEVAVVEMGISDFGEMSRLSNVARPDICVITNIGQCHLEKLQDRNGVLKAKTEIFDYMGKDSVVILNKNDDKLSKLLRVRVGKALNSEGYEVSPLFFGKDMDAFDCCIAGNVKNLGLLGSDALITYGYESMEVHIPLCGEHMVMNAAAATLVGRKLGLPMEMIKEGIEKATACEGRGKIYEYKDMTLIDDCYNANPVSVKAGLKLLGITKGYRTAILGDMFELGEKEKELHYEVGKAAASEGIDRLICIGKLSENTFCGAKEMNTGMKIFYYEDLDSFLKEIKTDIFAIIPKDSSVLVKASHGMKFTRILDTVFEIMEN
ncbi:MAG: UDP-N-acetylmuramoyl-tripeptide--D-alanyl-D-alanine ligase [Lachnospiraceae bacterium]|nr:UDP-N-acetylmuramoyl-tripeptide--D-alanyl-D-alanine ligase [Lachnospiraceae bacterium]